MRKTLSLILVWLVMLTTISFTQANIFAVSDSEYEQLIIQEETDDGINNITNEPTIKNLPLSSIYSSYLGATDVWGAVNDIIYHRIKSFAPDNNGNLILSANNDSKIGFSTITHEWSEIFVGQEQHLQDEPNVSIDEPYRYTYAGEYDDKYIYFYETNYDNFLNYELCCYTPATDTWTFTDKKYDYEHSEDVFNDSAFQIYGINTYATLYNGKAYLYIVPYLKDLTNVINCILYDTIIEIDIDADMVNRSNSFDKNNSYIPGITSFPSKSVSFPDYHSYYGVLTNEPILYGIKSFVPDDNENLILSLNNNRRFGFSTITNIWDFLSDGQGENSPPEPDLNTDDRYTYVGEYGGVYVCFYKTICGNTLDYELCYYDPITDYWTFTEKKYTFIYYGTILNDQTLSLNGFMNCATIYNGKAYFYIIPNVRDLIYDYDRILHAVLIETEIEIEFNLDNETILIDEQYNISENSAYHKNQAELNELGWNEFENPNKGGNNWETASLGEFSAQSGKLIIKKTGTTAQPSEAANSTLVYAVDKTFTYRQDNWRNNPRVSLWTQNFKGDYAIEIKGSFDQASGQSYYDIRGYTSWGTPAVVGRYKLNNSAGTFNSYNNMLNGGGITDYPLYTNLKQDTVIRTILHTEPSKYQTFLNNTVIPQETTAMGAVPKATFDMTGWNPIGGNTYISGIRISTQKQAPQNSIVAGLDYLKLIELKSIRDEVVDEAVEQLSISDLTDSPNAVISKLKPLPKSLCGADITWTSSNPEVMSNSGVVISEVCAYSYIVMTAKITNPIDNFTKYMDFKLTLSPNGFSDTFNENVTGTPSSQGNQGTSFFNEYPMWSFSYPGISNSVNGEVHSSQILSDNGYLIFKKLSDRQTANYNDCLVGIRPLANQIGATEFSGRIELTAHAKTQGTGSFRLSTVSEGEHQPFILILDSSIKKVKIEYGDTENGIFKRISQTIDTDPTVERKYTIKVDTDGFFEVYIDDTPIFTDVGELSRRFVPGTPSNFKLSKLRAWILNVTMANTAIGQLREIVLNPIPSNFHTYYENNEITALGNVGVRDIRNIFVRILDPENNIVIIDQIKSDSSGNFRLTYSGSGLPNGTYQVLVSIEGEEKAIRKTIDIGGKTTIKEIIPKKPKTSQLPSVTITDTLDSNGNIIITTLVTNNHNEPQEVSTVAVLYDNNENVIEYTSIGSVISANASDNSVMKIYPPSGNTVLKIFAVEGMNMYSGSITPLAEPKIIFPEAGPILPMSMGDELMLPPGGWMKFDDNQPSGFFPSDISLDSLYEIDETYSYNGVYCEKVVNLGTQFTVDLKIKNKSSYSAEFAWIEENPDNPNLGILLDSQHTVPAGETKAFSISFDSSYLCYYSADEYEEEDISNWIPITSGGDIPFEIGEGKDWYGNTREKATLLKTEGSFEGILNGDGDIDILKFIPEASGSFIIEMENLGIMNLKAALFEVSDGEMIGEPYNLLLKPSYFAEESPVDEYHLQILVAAGKEYHLEIMTDYSDITEYKADIFLLPVSGYEMEYEPERWNDGEQNGADIPVYGVYYIQHDTNCYAYALNTQKNKRLQPGELAGKLYDAFFAFRRTDNGKEMIRAAKEDAMAIGGIFEEIGRTAVASPGTYKVALVIDSFENEPNSYEGDYHWYRQNDDGTWSHKPSYKPVTNEDAVYKIIYDPQLADRDNGKRYGDNWLNYSEFIGYFQVTPIPNGLIDPLNTMGLFSTNFIDDTLKMDPSAPAISVDSISSLEVGMTVSEVHNLIGLPQGLYGSGLVRDLYTLDDGNKLIVYYGVDRQGLVSTYILNPQ